MSTNQVAIPEAATTALVTRDPPPFTEPTPPSGAPAPPATSALETLPTDTETTSTTISWPAVSVLFILFALLVLAILGWLAFQVLVVRVPQMIAIASKQIDRVVDGVIASGRIAVQEVGRASLAIVSVGGGLEELILAFLAGIEIAINEATAVAVFGINNTFPFLESAFIAAFQNVVVLIGTQFGLAMDAIVKEIFAIAFALRHLVDVFDCDCNQQIPQQQFTCTSPTTLGFP